MSLVDELGALEELRQRGALTDGEFARAKGKLLESHTAPGGHPTAEELAAQLAEARCQAARAQLDLEWEIERQKHLMYSRSGPPTIPTYQMAYGLFGVGAFFGLVTLLTFVFPLMFPGAGWFFPPVFGVVPVLGFGGGLYMFRCARRYQRALADYQSRRVAIRTESFPAQSSGTATGAAPNTTA